MYVLVRNGDRLPSVALAQGRLVEHGAQLVVDGHFGPRTRDAVLAFQRTAGVAETGAVDPPTWAALSAGHSIEVVDHVDATDLQVLTEDGPFLRDGHSHVAVSYGMSRGMRDLVQRLVSRHRPRSVALLRFHGHGGPGHMVVSAGTMAHGSSMLAGEHFRNPEAVAQYARLGSIMRPHGSIELHGCRVAALANGARLLSSMAQACGVPVTAGMRSQTGGTRAARFEGPVSTRCPGGAPLRTWARRAFVSCEW